MGIVIDIADPVPVLAQLIAQITKAVLSDTVFPGDALPSIQQLANDLGLDNETVANAYRLLERDSIIQTRGYRGTCVHPSQLGRCLRHGADHGWPPSLLNWMKGA